MLLARSSVISSVSVLLAFTTSETVLPQNWSGRHIPGPGKKGWSVPVSPPLVAITSVESLNGLEKPVIWALQMDTSSFCLENFAQMVSHNYFIPKKKQRKVLGFLYLNKRSCISNCISNCIMPPLFPVGWGTQEFTVFLVHLSYTHHASHSGYPYISFCL